MEVTDPATNGVAALQRSMALRDVSHVVLVQPGTYACAHARLLDALHVELSASAGCLGALAPLLAHRDRVFVAVPAGPCPATTDGRAADSLRWWLGMGNLYFKLVCAAPTPASAPVVMPWLDFVLDCALDRVLWGSGWPVTAPVAPGWHERHGDALPLARILDGNAMDLYGFGACKGG